MARLPDGAGSHGWRDGSGSVHPGYTHYACTLDWDFGGASVPNQFTSPEYFSSDGASFPAAGTYSGSVSASNQFASGPSYAFTTIVLTPPPPTIRSSSGGRQQVNVGTNFSMEAFGTSDALPELDPSYSWDWDFSGGVDNIQFGGTRASSYASADALTPGDYTVRVTVSNAGGSDSLDLEYTVI
ncbi:MAG: PKD domain-containing protein [bacterium]|nr:PKD domain-containing protein [bacterium]